jgi:asparagine synthase (glutamine-hydrolysing)
MTAFAAALRHRADGDGDGDVLEYLSQDAAHLFLSEAGISLCASARIDNRRDLASTLGLQPDVPLERLLLAGWRAWEAGLADRLRGAFALTIHSAPDGLLYVARDAFGVEPVYYAQSPSGFVIANSSRAVRALSGLKHSPDRRLLADFLSGGEGDFEHTFFEGIHRLPPGHWLTLRGGEVRIERYWSPTMAPRLPNAGTDAAGKFRELFDRSLAHCYEPGRSGLLLSGGLDSSAIAGSLVHAFGAGPELTALSMTYNQTPNWHDGPHIDALRAALPFTFADMPADSHDPLDRTDHYLAALDGPYFSYGQSVTFAANRILAESGIPIVLNGHGGDEIVSYGFGRLNELAREGRWLALWTQAKVVGDLQHWSRWRVLSPYLDHLLTVRRIRSRLRRFRNRERAADGTALLTESARGLLDRAGRQRPARERSDHDERMIQEASLSSAQQATALEVIALSSRETGLETRMPFCDRDLAEFSLSLPSDTKLGEGCTRLILRKAMRGRVPATVLARSDKFDFTTNFIRGLLNNRDRLFDLADPGNARLTELVSSSRLQYLRNEVSQKGTGIDRVDAFTLWRVAMAAQWLDLEALPAQPQPPPSKARAE